MNRIEDFLKQRDWETGSKEGKDWEWCDMPTWHQTRLKPLEGLEMLRSLFEQVSKRNVQAIGLKERVDELARKVEQHERLLRELFGGADLPQSGSFEIWCGSDRAFEFRGKHVVFAPGKGAVASADSLDELMAGMGGKLQRDMVVGFVPNF